MRKDEFMRQLETLLADISEEERREALSYYWSYFEDAGEENEERILRELESPDKVAATIKADLRMEQGKEDGAYADNGAYAEGGSYTEHGYEDSRFQDSRQEMEVNASPAGNREWNQEGRGAAGNQGWNQERGGAAGSQGWNRERSRSKSDENSTLKIILLTVIAVLTSPIWMSVLGSIIGLIVGAIGLVIGFIGVAVGLYVTGGVLFGIGIGQFVVGSIGAGFGFLGAAMLVWVVAVLMTVLCVWICGKGVPLLCNGVRCLWKKIFPGKERTV